MGNPEIAEALIAHYNAHDADAYAALLTDSAVEANYPGQEMRKGREAVRQYLSQLFAQWPQTRIEITHKEWLADWIPGCVVLSENVWMNSGSYRLRVSIFSFEAGLCSRVEYIG